MLASSRKILQWIAVLVVVVAAVLVYRNTTQPIEVSPKPEASPTPSSAITKPKPSLQPTATPTPTSSRSPVASPTSSPIPTPTPTPTPSATPSATPVSSGTLYFSIPNNGSLSATDSASSLTSVTATYQGANPDNVIIKSLDVQIEVRVNKSPGDSLSLSTVNGNIWEYDLSALEQRGYLANGATYASENVHINFAVPLQVGSSNSDLTFQANGLDMVGRPTGDGVIIHVTKVNLANSSNAQVANLPFDMKMVR